MRRLALFLLLAAGQLVSPALAQIPHGQDKPPGPALSPEEALKKMTVPEGFTVELVASEPDIVNPVAMTIDERGRFWITESFEYPRREPGPGRDRVKVLEDTDGDGRAENVTIFAEGLNIPSGIAVGYGGVWVANAPDILFMQDTDGDGKSDKQEVVVTGFGRDDTHELPNSLTWGPDGWLYGLNGVFNGSHVKYPKESPHYREDHPGWRFTCAMFRIHPRTREFQVFCEGTSNPWGIAFDHEGSAFISACVIDHLWHLTETGYYHRQGGPYPPFTWKIGSIVKHKHQKAAYCGIHYFDSDAYPEQYRDKLYMGNIHGGCINSDKLERRGSTYFATGEPDFLTANDAWFMPVVQKTGPDGCLYVLDWYDRYHCYQDANRDPQGIDRGHGRLYRVRYRETPRVAGLNLAEETDDQLIERLSSGNVFLRDIAQRLLAERADVTTSEKLEKIVLDDLLPKKTRMHALWAVVAMQPLDPGFHAALLNHGDASLRAWGVRAAGNMGKVEASLAKKIVSMSRDPSPDVKLQVAIAARKIEGLDAVGLLMDVIAQTGDDPLLPHIVWQNLHPLLEEQSPAFVRHLERPEVAQAPAMKEILPRAVDRILAVRQPNPLTIATLFASQSSNEAVAGKCLEILAARVQSHELKGEQLTALRQLLERPIAAILKGDASRPLYLDAAVLAASWKDEQAVAAVRAVARDGGLPVARRRQAIEALVTAGDASLLTVAAELLADEAPQTIPLRRGVLSALSRLDRPEVAKIVLERYASLEAELKPQAIELLTGRSAWATQLLAAIDTKQISPDALNVNQVRNLLSLRDEKISELVTRTWGTLRTDRDPAREEMIAEMRKLIRSTPGDPHRGQELYKKLCGQCHKLHGEGEEVGPDITVNGRGSFEQLLSNVFDPNLVIGASYQSRTVTTTDGRVLTGLLVEDNDQRVVLKQQGGKLETIARADVEEIVVSPLSLMPEGIEKQYSKQEIADLFAYLTLDKPPSDPSARFIPGTKELKPREEHDPKKYGSILDETLTGFATERSGLGGVALLEEHLGRPYVVRTHPIDQKKPCVLTREVEIPEGKKTRLALSVSHYAAEPGDWQLIVKVDGKPIHEQIVGPKTTQQGWLDVAIDLTPYAGKKIRLELVNQPNNWFFEYAYWARAEVISE